MDENEQREAVRAHYRRIAKEGACGCGPTASKDVTAYAADLGYDRTELASIPAGSNLALSCGNPLGESQPCEGETVLDLGAGAGFDAFVAANHVGPNGRVIGVDMTQEMVQRATERAHAHGFDQVEFRLGRIEDLPVADATVDLVVSNCVVNLVPDKAAVYAEAYRVLRPGGRIAISDMITLRGLPEGAADVPELVCGCVGGAAHIDEVRAWLHHAGFEDISIEAKGDSEALLQSWGVDEVPPGTLVSATIQARKPVGEA